MTRGMFRTLAALTLWVGATLGAGCGGGNEGAHDQGTGGSGHDLGTGGNGGGDLAQAPPAADLSPSAPADLAVVTGPSPDLSTPAGPPNDLSVTPATDTATAPQGHLRFVHASPVAGKLDVYLQGATVPLFANVAYGGATPYAALPAGMVTLEVRSAGDPASAPAKLTTPATALAADAGISAVAAGLLGGTDAASTLRVAFLSESFAVPAAGKANVRLFQASYAIGATVMLGFDLGDDGSQEAKLARFGDSDAAGFAVDGGKPLRVSLWNGATRQGSFTVPAAAVRSGASLLLLFAGLNRLPDQPDSFVLLASEATAAAASPDAQLVRQDPALFVLQAADSGAVDLFAGDKKVVTNKAFPTAVGALPLIQPSPSPDGLVLSVYPTSAATSPPAGGKLGDFTVKPLEAGRRYLVVLSGAPAAARPLQLDSWADEFVGPQADMFGRVRVINAVTDLAGGIDVGRWVTNAYKDLVVGGVTPFAGLGFGLASEAGGTPVVDGATQVGLNPAIRESGTTAPVKHFTLATQMSTDRFFVVPAGAVAPVSGQQTLKLIVVNAPRESLAPIAIKQLLSPLP
jgi:hypothetical protein